MSASSLYGILPRVFQLNTSESKPRRESKVKTDRWFYSASGAIFLVSMLVGFRHFVANGTASDGSPLNPAMFRLDLIHGIAIAAWYALFFTQSLLISVGNRRLHFKLGWGAVAVALAIAVTGPWVATRSVQNTPPDFHFFGMQYPGSCSLCIRRSPCIPDSLPQQSSLEESRGPTVLPCSWPA